jgi:transposase-like protein
MMGKQRQRHSEEFKAKVAMAAMKGDKTLSELAQQYQLHPTQITQWKQRLLSGAAELFQDGRVKKHQPREAISREDLLRQIGQLTVELEWLRRKTASLDGG